MQRASSIFQDPRKRESIAALLEYDIENPLNILDSAVKRKPSLAPIRMKSSYSTFDLKAPQSTTRDSKSFAPSKSTSMTHLSLSAIPMTTPISRPSSVRPKHMIETPKPIGAVVESKIIREREFIHSSAKLVQSFLIEKCYENPVTFKSLLNPTVPEVINIFAFLLSFIDEDLKNEVKVKEDIPNVLALIGYPYTIKKSVISAMNSPHNWPTVLASLRYIVELLEEVLPHKLGIYILFPPTSFSEDATHYEQFKEEMIRTSRMSTFQDEPEILESFRKELADYYEESLYNLRNERQQLMSKRNELTKLNAELEKTTLAVYQDECQEKCEQLLHQHQHLISMEQQLRDNQNEKMKLEQEQQSIQQQTTAEKHKFETLAAQVQCQAINIETAMGMKEEITAIRLEIERQRTFISNYHDKIIELRMQHSKRMSKVRTKMSQANLALNTITLTYQGCYDGAAEQLGIQFESANYEFMKSPEQLSREIQRNSDKLQDIKVQANATKSKLLQNELEANYSVDALKNSVIERQLEVKEIENQTMLQKESNDKLEELKVNLMKEQSDKKIKLDQEVYQLRRECEEGARLLSQLENERDRIITAGREENERMHTELNKLAEKVESVMDLIVVHSNERKAILSSLGQLHEAYIAMFSKD